MSTKTWRGWPRLTATLDEYAAVMIAMAVGGVLRILQLGTESLWVDETITLWFVNGLSYTELLTQIPQMQPHLPLYYVLVQAWIDLTGLTGAGVRPLSVIFSIGTIFGLYLVGRDLYDRQTGLIAAAVLAINPFALHFSQFIRMYSLVPCLTAFSMWAFIRVQHKGGRRAYATYLLATGLLAWSHFFGLLVLATQATYLVITHTKSQRQERQHGWQALLAVTPIALGVIGLLAAKLVGGIGFSSAQQIVHIQGPPTLRDIAHAHVRFIELFWWTYGTVPQPAQFVLNSLPIIAYVIAGVALVRSWRPVDALVTAWWLVPVTAAVIASYLVHPVFQPKYLGFAALALHLGFARGVRTLSPPSRPVVVISILVAGLILPVGVTLASPQIQEFEPTADYVEDHAQDGDVVFVNTRKAATKKPLRYYFDDLDTSAQVVLYADTPPADALRTDAGNADTVWVVVEHNQPRWESQTKTAFPSLTHHRQFHGISVYRTPASDSTRGEYND